MSNVLRWTDEELAEFQSRQSAPLQFNVSANPQAGKNPRKYRNEPVELNGERFDSKAEAARWMQLLILERAGKIKDLRRQVRFDLVPAQRTATGKRVAPVAYVADMVYLDGQGRMVVEDVKGFRTADYKLKLKLMLYVHSIEIQEVKA